MLQVPKLTIIMPVYNTAQYLPRAFDASTQANRQKL